MTMPTTILSRAQVDSSRVELHHVASRRIASRQASCVAAIRRMWLASWSSLVEFHLCPRRSQSSTRERARRDAMSCEPQQSTE